MWEKSEMAYTVKQVAAMSGVSVRTLHFYDETDVLKPAYIGTNGYRFYEAAQLLMLQQILFYRELGFELKQIKTIVGRVDFEKVAVIIVGKPHRGVFAVGLLTVGVNRNVAAAAGHAINDHVNIALVAERQAQLLQHPE